MTRKLLWIDVFSYLFVILLVAIMLFGFLDRAGFH